MEKHWQFVVFYRPPPTNTSFQHIPLTILPTTTVKHFGPTFSNDNLWCFTDHHIQTPHFCGDNIEKNQSTTMFFSTKKCTLALTGMDDFCIHFHGFVYFLLQSRKLAADRRTASDKFPGGPIVFVNSPDRLSGKLFCQPLPLRIDKLRCSVNST